jgi:hypothetical protein
MKRKAAPKPLKLRSDVAQFLADLAVVAEKGEIVGVYIVMQGSGGSYREGWLCDDPDEMLLEVGSAKIRTRIELERERQAEGKSQ